MATVEEITLLLQGLSAHDLDEVAAFIKVSKRKRADGNATAWCFDFVNSFAEATVTASRDPAGMEVRVDDATCEGKTLRALWEHPPVAGTCIVGFLVPVPTGLGSIKLRFSIGIRDGAELPADRFVAFRVLVNGWKLWSTVKNSHAWEEHTVTMPQLGSDVVRIEFVTDGLGRHEWDWAVWGLPRLEGDVGT